MSELNARMVLVWPNCFRFDVSYPRYGFWQTLSDGSVYVKVCDKIPDKSPTSLNICGLGERKLKHLEVERDIKPGKIVSLKYDGEKFVKWEEGA